MRVFSYPDQHNELTWQSPQAPAWIDHRFVSYGRPQEWSPPQYGDAYCAITLLEGMQTMSGRFERNYEQLSARARAGLPKGAKVTITWDLKY